MEPITLKIAGKAISVKPLVNNRAVHVAKVVVRGRCAWAVTKDGDVLCADTTSIRGRCEHRWADITEAHLSNDDMFALGALGMINAKDAAKAKESQEYAREYRRCKQWLQDEVTSLREAGIMLQKDWKERLEKGAHAYAKRQQRKRREVSREMDRLRKRSSA